MSEATTKIGHPRGLSTLFFTEMWERFSYYGMRAILTPFMLAAIPEGGLGFDKSGSGSIYALYTAAVYMLALPGGWIADKFMGQKRAVFVGGVIIMIGHILLAIPELVGFYSGLICLALGTGFLKPNVSSMVGQLYQPGDARRDSAYSIYYMGINVGAFASPIICGWLAQEEFFKDFLEESVGIDGHYSWHIAFGAAAVGMAFGLVQFVIGKGNLVGVGDPPTITDPVEKARNNKILLAMIAAIVAIPAILYFLNQYLVGNTNYEINKEALSNIFGVMLIAMFTTTFVVLYLKATNERERNGVKAMVALAIGCVAFFALFEQAGSTMNAFAEERTRNEIFGTSFPSTWFQSANSVFIIIFSPIFAWFFVWIVAKKYAFNDIKKFGAALIFMALAFAVMLPAAGKTGVSPMYLVGFYFLSTLAELFLSPVGLSSMSKLAPPSAAGLVMGVWFMSTSNGDWIAGKMHGLTASLSESYIFTVIIVGGLVVAALMFAFGHYFTVKVPFESLQNKADESDAAVADTSERPHEKFQISGNAVAGFATAAAMVPVVLLNADIGTLVALVLGPAAIVMLVSAIKEIKKSAGAGATGSGLLSGNGFVMAAVPCVLFSVAWIGYKKLIEKQPDALVLSGTGVAKLAPNAAGGLDVVKAAIPGYKVKLRKSKDKTAEAQPTSIYDVKQDGVALLTVVAQAEVATISIESPKIKTVHGVTLGGSYEQLKKAEKGLQCQAFQTGDFLAARGWRIVCAGESAIAYSFGHVGLYTDPDPAGAKLDELLTAKKFDHISLEMPARLHPQAK